MTRIVVVVVGATVVGGEVVVGVGATVVGGEVVVGVGASVVVGATVVVELSAGAAVPRAGFEDFTRTFEARFAIGTTGGATAEPVVGVVTAGERPTPVAATCRATVVGGAVVSLATTVGVTGVLFISTTAAAPPTVNTLVNIQETTARNRSTTPPFWAINLHKIYPMVRTIIPMLLLRP